MLTITVLPSTNIYTNFLILIAHYKDQGSINDKINLKKERAETFKPLKLIITMIFPVIFHAL